MKTVQDNLLNYLRDQLTPKGTGEKKFADPLMKKVIDNLFY